MRWFLVAGSALFLLLCLPGDLASIADSLAGPDRRLALGLSLKTLMAVVAIIGLARDATVGYAFLLGISLQSCVVRVGDLMGVWPAVEVSGWQPYLGQLVLPVTELAFRAVCLGYLALNWRRMVGGR